MGKYKYSVVKKFLACYSKLYEMPDFCVFQSFKVHRDDLQPSFTSRRVRRMFSI